MKKKTLNLCSKYLAVPSFSHEMAIDLLEVETDALNGARRFTKSYGSHRQTFVPHFVLS